MDNKPPFDGPYRKSSEPRKDKYGNTIKPHNIAKHLAKKALQRQLNKEEEGAYSRYSSSAVKKRKEDREKRNAGTTQAQRMKNKMYSGMMGGLNKEEVEQVDELKKSTLGSYIKKASDDRALASRFSGGEYIGHKDARRTAAKRKKGIAKAANKLAREEVEQVDEGLSHDRYMRSHGKKASGTGNWYFTTKRMGDPKPHEMHSSRGTLSDAHKEASKKLGTKNLYVMEEVEQIDELKKSTLMSYIGKAQKSKSDMLSKQAGMQRKNDYASANKMSKKIGKRDDNINKATMKVIRKEEVELEENAVHKISAKYGFVKKTEKSPSTGKSTTGMVHPKTGERISSMGHMQQSFGHSRKDGSTVKTGSTTDLHKHLQSKGYKMNEEVEQIDELSKDTLSSYRKKAMQSSDKLGQDARKALHTTKGTEDERIANANKITAKKVRRDVAVDKVRGKIQAKEEVKQTDEARAPRAPSNYAAMMIKKRRKAGTSEFGRHPDKKLSPTQDKHLDVHDDGKIDAKDFKKLRQMRKNKN